MYVSFLDLPKRAFRSVVDRLLCMLKVKGSNPLMSTLFSSLTKAPYPRRIVDSGLERKLKNPMVK